MVKFSVCSHPVAVDKKERLHHPEEEQRQLRISETQRQQLYPPTQELHFRKLRNMRIDIL
jgi:hypothetical protein